MKCRVLSMHDTYRPIHRYTLQIELLLELVDDLERRQGRAVHFVAEGEHRELSHATHLLDETNYYNDCYLRMFDLK